LEREPLNPKERLMSKIETDKIETGKIENDHTARMLSDDELDAVSGGLIYPFTDLLCSS